ncbi:Rz1-like lysis system protein LysC [Acinetobacter sp.]|uniref:Rz1-like lysis system protein LysC n=1 Tax=Acinetobacter sp. TaxID=472 RepID=UPI003FCC3539
MCSVTAGLLLTACSSPSAPTKLQIPAAMLVPCDKTAALKTGGMGELYTRYIENLEIHAECASKVNAWIEIGEALK